MLHCFCVSWQCACCGCVQDISGSYRQFSGAACYSRPSSTHSSTEVSNTPLSIHPAIVIMPKQPLKNKTTHKIKTQNKLREYDNTDIDTGGGTVPVIIDVLKVAEASLTFKSHVTSAPSLSIFCCRLKSHLFSLSYPAFWLFSHLYGARAVTHDVHPIQFLHLRFNFWYWCFINLLTYLLTYNILDQLSAIPHHPLQA